MKSLYIKTKKRTLLSTLIISIICLYLITLTQSCKSSEDDCLYTVIEPCEEVCNIFEDFESDTIGGVGNWQTRAIASLGVVNKNNSKMLNVKDGPGASIIYNEVSFSNNLLDQGCALRYDVEYLANNTSNSSTTSHSIQIYSGNVNSPTLRASFTINSSNLITSGTPQKTIEVPLELANGNILPSNSFGAWSMTPSSGNPATDANNFNTLIQNITGVFFIIDEGDNPSEEWWLDNFCFKKCCPNNE